MATIARNSDPIDEIQLVAPAVPDRLPAMLFLAALIHGILIIGVTFNPYLIDEISDAISLEVTIVADPDQKSTVRMKPNISRRLRSLAVVIRA